MALRIEERTFIGESDARHWTARLSRRQRLFDEPLFEDRAPGRRSNLFAFPGHIL